MPVWKKSSRKPVPRGYMSHLRGDDMTNLPIIQRSIRGRLQEPLRKLIEGITSSDADYERETPGDGCVRE